MRGRISRCAGNASQIERIGDSPFQTKRCEQTHPGPAQPPDREVQYPRRRAVKPLDVVDGHDDGAPGTELDKGAERGERDGALVRWFPFRLLPQEGDFQRTTLRRREDVEGLLDVLEKKIAEGRIGERRLNLGRPSREHPVTGVSGQLAARFPQGRLADARRSLEEHSGRSGRNVLDEARERVELRRPTDDRFRRGPHPPHLRPLRAKSRRSRRSIR